MTDQQINAAIAEACGWKDVCQHPKNPNVWVGKHAGRLQEVPDYCDDLNAMHEAEKVLAPKNWNNFSEKWHDYYWYLRRADADRAIHATARQRAEAFLRTLGKWEEGE
jgi:hypothetical protein